jgi:hypothetical protein
VFELKAAKGACFVRFFSPEYTPYIQVGHLPSAMAQQDPAFRAFQGAHAKPESLQEVTDPARRRRALQTLINVLQRKEDSLIEFMVPQSSMRGGGGERSAADPTAACAPEPDSAPSHTVQDAQAGAPERAVPSGEIYEARRPDSLRADQPPTRREAGQRAQGRAGERSTRKRVQTADSAPAAAAPAPTATVAGCAPPAGEREAEHSQTQVSFATDAQVIAEALRSTPLGAGGATPGPTESAQSAVHHTHGHHAQHAQESQEESVDNELASFWTLANEILYEDPPMGTYGTRTYEAWRVWGCAAATLVARYFDDGSTYAIGALIDEAWEHDAPLNEAITQLTECEGVGDEQLFAQAATSAAGAMAALTGQAATAHLATLLKRYRDSGGLVFQTGIQGRASITTTEHLERIRRTYSRVRSRSAKLSSFQVIANLYLEDARARGQLAWSVDRERRDAERIEVLGHSVHPRALLLIYFEPARDTRAAALYMPPAKEPMAAMTFCSRATALLEDRQLSAMRARGLPVDSEFERVAPREAIALLEESLDLIDDEIGTTYEFPLRGDAQDLSDRVVLV